MRPGTGSVLPHEDSSTTLATIGTNTEIHMQQNWCYTPLLTSSKKHNKQPMMKAIYNTKNG